MADYRFLTVWHIVAPLESAWNAIHDTAHWPAWWRGVEGVEELASGDRCGIGTRCRYTWKGRLPYRLRFDARITAVEPLVSITGVVSGELEGIGRWLFSRRGRVARICYEWRVRTVLRWMDALDPLARPLFEWNHNGIMDDGCAGIARLLRAPQARITHR
jgi:hypothetical protein